MAQMSQRELEAAWAQAKPVGRKVLTPEQAAALGLPTAQPSRVLSREQAAALGLPAFDPDAYLAGQAPKGNFDPDAYLRGSSGRLTEAEMMADLAKADAAGDTQLAQTIAGRIKAARAQPNGGAFQIVDIPGVGEVEFPANMSDAAVTKAARNLAARAAPAGRTESGARGALQGLTRGWADEASGAIAAALPFLDREAAQGATFRERYENARDFYRGRNETAQQQNPGTYLAGQVGGAFVGPKGLGLGKLVAEGAATGAGYSTAGDAASLARDTAIGGGTALAVKGAGAALGKAATGVARYAHGKTSAAAARATSEATEAAQAALRSETSRLGGLSQDLNRKVEWVIRLLDEESSGTLTAQNRAALEAFRKTPEYGEVVNKAAERVLSTVPGAAQGVAAQEAKVAAMQAALPQTIQSATGRALSREMAKEQIKARVRRYGPPALGSAIGASIGGPVGVAVGALAGAGTRPMVHALRRMGQHPSVQTAIWSPVEAATTAAVSGGTTGKVLRQAVARAAQQNAIARATAEAERQAELERLWEQGTPR